MLVTAASRRRVELSSKFCELCVFTLPIRLRSGHPELVEGCVLCVPYVTRLTPTQAVARDE